MSANFPKFGLFLLALATHATLGRSVDGMRLVSAVVTEPIADPQPPLVTITSKQILVDGIAAGSPSALEKAGDWSIATLDSKLATAKKSATDGRIVFAVEPEIAYRIVKKTLFAANKAGFAHVLFAVRNTNTGQVAGLRLRQGRAAPPGVVRQIGQAETAIVSSLSPDVIDAVIRKNLTFLRRCYERELPKSPDLEGVIVVTFTVDGDGTVSSEAVKSSTMGNAQVENCVLESFSRIAFPKVTGGGTVTVNYPLRFATGS